MSDAAPATIESLTAEIAHARNLIALYRQQRDQASAAANDLHIEIALLQQQLDRSA